MSQKRFFIFFTLSLVLHLLLGIGLSIEEGLHPKEAQAKKTQVLWVSPRQLVDLPQNVNHVRPEQATFVSTHDSKVKKERVAAKKNPRANLSDVSHPQKKKSTQNNTKGQNRSKTTALNLNANVPKKKASPKGEPFTPSVSGETFQESKWDHFNHDFFPQIQTGEKTWVNAYGVPDAQYFTRLKRAFRLRFNPAPPLRSYFSHHGVTTRKVLTTMVISLDAKGRLIKLSVSTPSGIVDYDEESLSTVRDSNPFTSPPSSLLYKGALTMKWSFITHIL